MAGDAQHDLALGERLVHQLELVVLEVAQPAVDQLGGGGGGGRRQVGALDQQRGQPAAGGVARDAGAVDAAANDEHVAGLRMRSGVGTIRAPRIGQLVSSMQ